MGIRDEQVALTRRRILEAFRELSAGPGAIRVSVAEVARHSGLAPATVYRHFPNREALVHAAANQDVALGVEPGTTSWTLDHLHQHLCALWSQLEGNMPVTREGALTEAGREQRRARYASFRPSLEAGIAAQGIDPASTEGRHLVATLALLSGVHAFIDLHDRQGRSAVDAADTVAWAAARLVEAVGLDPLVLRFEDATDPTVDQEERE